MILDPSDKYPTRIEHLPGGFHLVEGVENISSIPLLRERQRLKSSARDIRRLKWGVPAHEPEASPLRQSTQPSTDDDSDDRPALKYLYVLSSRFPFVLSAESVEVALEANKLLQKFITKLEKHVGTLLYQGCSKKGRKWLRQIYQGEHETVEFSTEGSIIVVAHDAKSRTRFREAIVEVMRSLFGDKVADEVDKAVVLGELRATLAESMEAGGVFNLIEAHARLD